MVDQVDELGITELEEKQMAALAAGASPEDVANLSRQDISEIPRMIPPVSPPTENTDNEYLDIDEEERINTDEEYLIKQETISDSAIANTAIYGSLATEGDLLNTFINISNELSATGKSNTYDQITQNVREDAELELTNIVGETAALADKKGVEALITASPVLIDEKANVRNRALEKSSELVTSRQEISRNKDYQDWFLDNLEDRATARRHVNRIITMAAAEGSLDLVDNAADFADTAIIGEQVPLSSVSKEILGERYFVLGGDMVKDLAEWILSHEPKDQPAAAQRVVDSYTKHAGLIAHNDVVRAFSFQRLQEYINTPGLEDKGIPWARYIDNAIGVVDLIPLIPVAGIARGVGKLIGVAKTSRASGKGGKAVDAVSEANPEIGSSMTVDAIQSEMVAQRTGTTQAEAVQRTLPSADFEVDVLIEGAPDSLKDKIQGLNSKSVEATEFIDNTFLFADRDYKNKMAKIGDILDSEKVTGISKTSIASFKRDGNSNAINIRAVYGDDSDFPINNLPQAKKLSSLLIDSFKKEGIPVKPEIQVKNEQLGIFEKYDPSIHPEPNQFYVALDTKYQMQFTDIIPAEFTDPTLTKQGVGQIKRFFLPPDSYINRSLLGAAKISNEKKFFIRRELIALTRPFTDLSFGSKKKVADLLKRGEEEATVFDWRTLRRNYTLKEIEGYYAARIFNESVYRIKNADLREKLLKEGFKRYRINFEDGKFYENAIRTFEREQVPTDIKRAFDLKLGKEIELTEENLNLLYNNGMQLGKVLRKLDNGNKEYSLAVIRGGEVSDLPTNVVPYRKGYNFRINNDPYFIKQKSKKIVDGKSEDVIKTVGVARNSSEARKFVDRLSAENPRDEFDVDIDRNISSDESILKQDMDLLDGSGLQFWFSRRGNRLVREDGSLSSVEDPVSAMNRLASSVANVATHRDLIELASVRHRKTYGSLEVKGKKIWEFDPTNKQWVYIGKEFSERARPQLKAANREYEYLEALKAVPTGPDKWWKDFLVDLDYSFGKYGDLAGAASTKVLLDGLAQVPPGVALRGVTFALTIALRPFKQLLLQWATGLSLSGIDPVATARAFKNSTLLLQSMTHWDSPKRWNAFVKPLTKVHGFEPEEWRTIFEEFRRTGKAYSIDSNVIISEANFSWSKSLPETRLGRAAQITGNVIKSPVTIGKEIGFDLGELGNQAVSWLFARDRWIKENPGKVWNANQTNLDQIAVNARNFSVDMTKTNAFPYQRGGFATMTQFISINHRMLLRALPTYLGGEPAFQGLRGRYIAGMLAMYGTAGVGMQEIYDSWKREEGLEIPNVLDNTIQGGFTNLIFNVSLDLAFGDEIGTARTDFSSTFSPAAGIVNFAPDLINNLMDGNFLEALAGPSGNILPRIGRAADHIRTIWGFDDLDTEQKIFESATNALGEFGAFSDVFKYNMSMAYKEKMDTFNIVDTKGRVGPPAIHSELFAKMILGIGLRSESELYNIWLEKKKEFASSGTKEVAQIDKDAKQLSEWMFKKWLESKDEIEFEQKTRSLLWSLHNGDRIYGLKVYEAAKRYFKRDPRYDKFINDIIRREGILDSEADISEMKGIVSTSDLINDEQKEKILNAIDALVQGREVSQQILDEVFQ